MIAEIDYLQIIISKEEIENNDLSQTLKQLNYLIKDKGTLERFHQRLDIGVSGYDNDKRELFEVPEVRKYLQDLDSKFPYWFYFLNNLHRSSLHLITFSCIDSKIENGRLHYDTASLQNFLNTHFAYMNQICDFVGMANEDNELLTELVLNNFQ
jgi:hypothetical protein